MVALSVERIKSIVHLRLPGRQISVKMTIRILILILIISTIVAVTLSIPPMVRKKASKRKEEDCQDKWPTEGFTWVIYTLI